MRRPIEIYHLSVLLALVFSVLAPAGAQWNWQSPVPQGNTLLKVQFVDSSNGWAVGEYGTALHTTTGGLTWYEQEYARTDNLFGLSMVSDSEGWSAGDNGTILHTTDGGDNWLEQISGVTVGLNTIHFVDSLHGWAGGDNETILRTTNGGASWSIQHQSFSPPVGVNAITFIDTSEGWAVGSSRSVFHTTNGGALWIKQTVGATLSTYLSVHFVTASLGLIAGSAGVILRTDDGGLTWTPITSGVLGNLNEILMQNTFVGWIAGDAGLFLKTINGGLSWSNVTVGEGENFNGMSRFGGKLWTVGEFGKIFLSTNSGVAWTELDFGSRLSANWIDFPTDSVGVAVGQAGLLLRTTDGGNTWSEQSSPAPSVSTYGVKCTDATNAWAVGDAGTILRTANGVNWTVQPSPVGHTLFGVDFGDATHGWIVGGEFATFTGVILRSTDAGTSWTVQAASTPNILYGVSFPNASAGWAVGENGLILHTTNGGAAWAPQTSGVSAALFWCSFADGQNGWAVGEQGTILHTSNGGSVWSQQNSGVWSNLYSVVERGGSEAFAVGDNGTALHTTDGGITWENEYSRTQRSLYAVAHAAGTGVWASGDYGTVLANGVPRETGASITGRVFNDLNQNGQLDFGEPGMQGWTIRLGGDKVDSTVSDASGLYRFLGLTPGSYTVEEALQAGWTQTMPLAPPYAFVATGVDFFAADFGDYASNAHGYKVNARWNLVSRSLTVDDPRTTTLYSNAISPAYAFLDLYSAEDTIVPGLGYWIKYLQSQTVWTLGEPILAETLSVIPGWNLIGMVEDTLLASSLSSDPPGNFVSGFFSYEGGYRQETLLVPGEGYWVQARDSGTLILASAPAGAGNIAARKPFAQENLNALTVSDREENSQSLYFGAGASAEGIRAASALPPLPPAGAFDARFADGYAVAVLTAGAGRPAEAVVAVRSAASPLTISWKIPERSAGVEYALRDARTGAVIAASLQDSGSVTIWDPSVRRIALVASAAPGAADLPRDFALLQNSPNPFNPSTTIRFTIPVRSSVRLTVYSLLGQEVARLVDAELDAGDHAVRWTPSGASGLYFYRIEAADVAGSGRHFSATRKMMVIK